MPEDQACWLRGGLKLRTTSFLQLLSHSRATTHLGHSTDVGQWREAERRGPQLALLPGDCHSSSVQGFQLVAGGLY